MSVPDPLSSYRVISDASPRYEVANVTGIGPGDRRVLDEMAEEWTTPRTFCAVCYEPFEGDVCSGCGMPRRSRA